MSDLKADLASLRLNDGPGSRAKGCGFRWRSSSCGGRGRAGVAQSAPSRAWRCNRDADVERTASAPAGTPMLTASGYIVARREAIVSSKIQGRLAELSVEEGSEVQGGDIIARLESTTSSPASRARAQVQQAEAAVGSADASIQRAEADLAEARRQLGVSERLIADKLVPNDQLDANKSRVKLAEAALAQSRAERTRTIASWSQAKADLTYADAQLQNTVIRAPFSGTVVRKMAEVGESVAPIPPGVNISTPAAPSSRWPIWRRLKWKPT